MQRGVQLYPTPQSRSIRRLNRAAALTSVVRQGYNVANQLYQARMRAVQSNRRLRNYKKNTKKKSKTSNKGAQIEIIHPNVNGEMTKSSCFIKYKTRFNAKLYKTLTRPCQIHRSDQVQ